MLLMIDNYDSFTYNLVQYFGELGQEVKTFRNDQITIEEIKKLDPKYIVISPGPCTPKESGISMQVIDFFKEKKPILGVCLGHQAIGAVFGANIIKLKNLCMVKPLKYSMMAISYLKACLIILLQPDIIL